MEVFGPANQACQEPALEEGMTKEEMAGELNPLERHACIFNQNRQRLVRVADESMMVKRSV